MAKLQHKIITSSLKWLSHISEIWFRSQFTQ